MSALKGNPLKNECPYCGYFTDRVGSLEANLTPSKGDVSLCIRCGNISEFGEKLKLVKFNLDTLTLEEKEEITRIKTAWRTTQKR